MMKTKNAEAATAKAAQPFTIEHLPTGQPALYCKRGLVAIFEAGYQQTREQDAAEIVRILNAHGELVEALQNTVERLEASQPTIETATWTTIKQARRAIAKVKGES